MPEFHIEKIQDAPPYAGDFFARHAIRGINCGSGTTVQAGCLNVDRMPLVDARGERSEAGRIVRIHMEGSQLYYLQHDLSQAFPIESVAFAWGYSEHFIEHIAPDHAIAWLAEMRRLIAPGGLLRITTPDLEKYVDGYRDPDSRFFKQHAERLGAVTGSAASDAKRRAWMVNQIFRLYEHQWIYDFDEIVHAASIAGFDPARIAREDFQSGLFENVSMMDTAWHNDETLYVELLT